MSRDCLICVDLGTTNTRVWLVDDGNIVATARAGAGVRDTARDGAPTAIHRALREAIAEVRAGQSLAPSMVIAAGMIGSPLGLREVAHLPAPVSIEDLAAGALRVSFPEIVDLPILLVPGVRCGPVECEPRGIGATDVMRGEETLSLGLAEMGLLGPEATLLNLGSHWKLIRLDGEARIGSSVTSLSGELIHAAQTQTILASSLPSTRPERLDINLMIAGMEEQRSSGLARALFCVRLLEQRTRTTPEERLSFLIGACLAADLDGMRRSGLLTSGLEVAISGSEVLANAWRTALAAESIEARILSESEIEQGLLTGLRIIAKGIGARDA